MKIKFARRTKSIVLTLSITATLFTLFYTYMLIALYHEANQHIEQSSRAVNEKVSERIDDMFDKAQNVTLRLNYEMQTITLNKEEIWGKLNNLSVISEGISGIGINFFPYALSESIRLFSPYIYRANDSYKQANVDDYYDYSIKQSFESSGDIFDHNIAQWLPPVYDEISKCDAIKYEVPIVVGGHQLGVGYSNYCIKKIINEINKNDLGNDSYFILMDAKRNILYNSMDTKSIVNIKKLLNSIELTASKTWSKQVRFNGKDSWVHSRKLANTGWYVVTFINKDTHKKLVDDVHEKSAWGEISQYLPLSSLLVLTSILWIVFVISKYDDLKPVHLWCSSFVISAIFTTGTLYIWNQFYSTYTEDTFIQDRVHNKASIRRVKLDYNIETMSHHKSPPIFVPTSLFIQSMEFVTAYNIKISGYVWQQYPIKTTLSPDDINHGVVFPEAETISIKKSYEHKDDKFLIVGWHFEGVFREKFNYDHYPFDQQLVWIRVWHTDFERNVVLTPMLDSYENINPSALPGLEKEFVINGWSIEKTFYGFRTNQYNTNFGMPAHLSKDMRPELYFNISLRRNFIDPFISYLFPVLVVLLMLFGVLVTTSANTDKPERLGFSASSVLSSSSALFFVSLISHVQLRNHVGTSRMIYLEYFFLVSYVMILMVVLNAILFSLPIKVKVIDYRDNLIPKTLYWPVLCGFFFFTTLIIYSN
ncbi:hypothetical protein EDC56_1104 [Sinobacterium caligoides]|uniref:Cache domain-containing protein n=1 Tax=Sinobacterium caligoides TaxID=933926 RepID=A0A3N2E0L3_9GAMM|nr:cache domain-containing protein [Sinobacterium caligoides]ROS05567.1 hypothetical protein EDC56_1104 [Sinobacterium caligoides]